LGGYSLLYSFMHAAKLTQCESELFQAGCCSLYLKIACNNTVFFWALIMNYIYCLKIVLLSLSVIISLDDLAFCVDYYRNIAYLHTHTDILFWDKLE
jgi:hypothetical protein